MLKGVQLSIDFGEYCRMRDGFEQQACRRIRKDQRGQFRTCKLPIRKETVRGENLTKTMPGRLAWGHNLPRDFIGIDDRDTGRAEIIRDQRFSAGNASGETDNHNCKPTVSRAAIISRASAGIGYKKK